MISKRLERIGMAAANFLPPIGAIGCRREIEIRLSYRIWITLHATKRL
jgi:hypothetical protein